jgi:hypothetical protein
MIPALSSSLRGYVTLASVIVALLLICYLIGSISVAARFSGETRRRRLRRAAHFSSAIVISTATVWTLVDYCWLAQLRRTAHACDSGTTEDGKYVATLCLLNSRFNYLRLYERDLGRLVADRTYRCDQRSDTKLIAGDTFAFDGCADGNESIIRLPPSLVDRLRAKLP